MNNNNNSPRGKTKVIINQAGEREREETIPGRVLIEPKLSAAEVGHTRKLVGVTMAAGTALGLLGVVLFQVFIDVVTNIRGPGVKAYSECVEDGEPTCAEGQVCRYNRCVDDHYVAPSTCQAGDACGPGVCECGAGLTCSDAVCAAPPTEVDVCEKPAVKSALAKLIAQCAGDIDACPASDLRKYAIESAEFDKLLAEFPGTVTLHFNSGAPPIDAGAAAWPPKPVHEHYLAELKPTLPHLAKARHIFIISRSSAFGDPRRNDKYAQARSMRTKELIIEALGRDPATTIQTRDGMRAKFADFLLGRNKPVDVGLFRSRYANRAVTWSDNSERMLRDLIARPELSAEDAKWLDRVMNQVVFVVPVPCDLGTPTPAAAGGGV